MRRLLLFVIIALLISTKNRASPEDRFTARRATPEVHGYLGFDRNEYPGDNNLAALRKAFAFSGYWLNAPPGDAQTNWSGKREQLQNAGFGFAILFNGRLFRELRGHDAAAIGHRDGVAAVVAAKREGFPPTSIIFLDQEEGGRLLAEQKAYLYAWVDAVNSGGYRAGVYCSGIDFVEGDGQHIMTANDIRENAGRRDIAFWVSNDACPPSPGCGFDVVPGPRTSGVPFATVWQFAQSPRRAEQTSQCARTYAPDGNCYPPGLQPQSGLHIDVSTATSPDPSHARR